MKRKVNSKTKLNSIIKKSRNAGVFLRSHSIKQVYNRVKAEVFNPRAIVSNAPCNLSINLTTACNMNCTFCSTRKYRNKDKPEHLSFSKAKLLLDKFKSANFAGFCGAGEPFLNPDLFKMAGYAKHLRMSVIIATNGILLNKRKNELLDSKIDTLEISFKASNPEDYKEFTCRKEDEFFFIISSLKDLTKLLERPRIVMTYVCNRKRINNIPQIIDIAEECNVDELTFFNLIPDMELGNEKDCLYMDDKQLLYDNFKPHTGRSITINMPGLYPRNSEQRNCRIPFQSLKIGSDGGVSACPRAIETNLKNGNVFISKDVFNKEHFVKLRNELINKKLPLRYECLYCNIRC